MTSSSATPARTGYEVVPGRFQAVPGKGPIDNDPSPMVQELIARLRFTAAHLPIENYDVLDYGCGTGVALQWLRRLGNSRRLVGVDASAGAIAFAKERYPGIDFDVLGAKPSPALTDAFDAVLCFEVLEHIEDPGAVLGHFASHYLRRDGVLVATTPNRLVFSAGMEPSPINRTHIHEMDLAELRQQLGRHFGEFEIWGMRYHDPLRMAAHTRNIRMACDGYKLLGERWWNPWINRLYRWAWRGQVWEVLAGKNFVRCSAADFEFSQENLEEAIWFLAVARKPIKSRQ